MIGQNRWRWFANSASPRHTGHALTICRISPCKATQPKAKALRGARMDQTVISSLGRTSHGHYHQKYPSKIFYPPTLLEHLLNRMTRLQGKCKSIFFTIVKGTMKSRTPYPCYLLFAPCTPKKSYLGIHTKGEGKHVTNGEPRSQSLVWHRILIPCPTWSKIVATIPPH